METCGCPQNKGEEGGQPKADKLEAISKFGKFLGTFFVDDPFGWLVIISVFGKQFGWMWWLWNKVVSKKNDVYASIKPFKKSNHFLRVENPRFWRKESFNNYYKNII